MAQFKTRARALDLLGRQQIAGIPTAINELIKNAYDAYADHFEADFLRHKGLLVLRDDGMGMTREEFESRWLTLGTESKLVKTSLPPRDPNKSKRPVTGEKGIGRLAIASIGRQLLVLTKSKQSASNQIVVSYINWELFELPELNIEDIVIPVYEFTDIPTENDVEIIKNDVVSTLHTLQQAGRIEKSVSARVLKDIKSFSINPRQLNETLSRIGQPFIQGGTQFYVGDLEDSLIADIDGDPGDRSATKMEKMLLGFQNTMTPEHPEALIDVTFRDYRSNDGTYVNIIDDKEFFTPEEFEKADHHIIGFFDKFGQFEGTVRIYGDKVYNHRVNWRDNHYRETTCGPFAIQIAYVQGEQKSTRIGIEDYAVIRAKTDRIGGLYIYRNNIRVLPYGDTDYDFLDMEKNRSKRYSSGFFSFRRIFGAVEIGDTEHSGLIEKAGREGFIENKAYREFQSILKNFFTQLSADFFDDKGDTPQSEYFKEKRSELNRIKEALERRDRQAKVRKAQCVKELDSFFADLDSGAIENNVTRIVERFRMDAESLSNMRDADIASERLLGFEGQARKAIGDYRKTIQIPLPKGFTVTKAIQEDYDSYRKELKVLDETVFDTASATIDAIISDSVTRLELEISKRKRLQQAVEQISVDAINQGKKKRAEIKGSVTDISQRILQLTGDLMQELDDQIRNVKSQFGELATKDAEDFDLVKERQRMEEEIESISERNNQVMDRIIRQLEGIYVEKTDDDYITNDQISDAMAEELAELRDRLQADVELSQMGLAVGILHHEFGSSIKAVRTSLKELRAWSDVDANLASIYQNIKVSFEHLDRYFSLFLPLDRRLTRKREDIRLTEVNNFLHDLFDLRLRRHNIALKHTKGFAKQTINGFRSTFYPVFVNIVDNAIYWLSQSDEPEKVIRLHADAEAIYVSNNGPSISAVDKDRIFELRFTRKPNGRGLGLSISRQVLNDEGFDITLCAPHNGATVTFKIAKKEQ